MLKRFRFLFLGGVLALLSGCLAPPAPVSQESVFVIWKTPSMRYADQGFLSHEGARHRLEVYANGQAVMKLTVTPSRICSGALCMSAKEFNLRYLSPHYPSGLLAELLAGRPIFGGEGSRRQDGGVIQKITKAGRYAIEYRRLNGSVIFHDTINHIIIEIRRQE
jgi:hypothetical protein